MTHDLNGPTRRDDEPAREPWFLHQPVEPEWGDLPTYDLPPKAEPWERASRPLAIIAVNLAAMVMGVGIAAAVAYIVSSW